MSLTQSTPTGKTAGWQSAFRIDRVHPWHYRMLSRGPRWAYSVVHRASGGTACELPTRKLAERFARELFDRMPPATWRQTDYAVVRRQLSHLEEWQSEWLREAAQ